MKLTHRVSSDLSHRLAQLGARGHCAATDLACALLAGAETGCTDLAMLLSRYLGPQTAASTQADRRAMESFRAAFAGLPIALTQLDEVLGQPAGCPGTASADGRCVESAIQPMEPTPVKVSSFGLSGFGTCL